MEHSSATTPSYEVRGVIRFLQPEGHTTNIHDHVCRVNDNIVVSDGGMRYWCRKFRNGCTNLHKKKIEKDVIQL